MNSRWHPSVLCAVALLMGLTACGNPEAPTIKDVRLSQRLADGTWQVLDTAQGANLSPILIQGVITDNTAVVAPLLEIQGERKDVPDGEQKTCAFSQASGLFECPSAIPGQPGIPALEIVRGDRIEITALSTEGDSTQLELSFTELPGQKSGDKNLGDLRIIHVNTVKVGTVDLLHQVERWCQPGSPPEECTPEGPEGSWVPLRSGDWVAIRTPPTPSNEDFLSIAILSTGIDKENQNAVTEVWQHLKKWNQGLSLLPDTETGFFARDFQLFDPRPLEPQEEFTKDNAPFYTLVISAHDVPNQKTNEVRSSVEPVGFSFNPARGQADQCTTEEPSGCPQIVVKEASEGATLVSTGSSQSVSGNVLDNSGEVKEFLVTLSGEKGQAKEVYLDPDSISLTGDFLQAVVLVSDWDGDGIVDSVDTIKNTVTAKATDINDNTSEYRFSVLFKPPAQDTSPPQIQVLSTVPTLDTNRGFSLIPDMRDASNAIEPLKMRGLASDDSGQPEVRRRDCNSCQEFLNNTFNTPRCMGCTTDPSCDKPPYGLDASSEFPSNQWEWTSIQKDECTEEDFYTDGVAKDQYTALVAKEKTQLLSSNRPKSTGLQIHYSCSHTGGPITGSISASDSLGPLVSVTFYRVQDGQNIELKGGDSISQQEHLVVEGTISPRNTTLNEIVALKNGEGPGQVGTATYNTSVPIDNFTWDLGTVPLSEGDQISVGGVSITGHKSLFVMEFAKTSEGTLRVVSSYVESNEICGGP